VGRTIIGIRHHQDLTVKLSRRDVSVARAEE